MRLSTGTLTVSIFAVLFGLVGAYALRASLAKPEVEPPPPPRMVPVPLAANPLPAGRKLALGDMVMVPMTQEDMKSRNYPLEQLMIDSNQIVGRILHAEMKQGDPFLTVNLYPEGTGPKLSDKLKPGMRAVTIPVDNLSAVGGSTIEGNFVDVLFRARARAADLDAGRPAIPATTVTLLENVEVLSVGRVAASAQQDQEEETVDVRNINLGIIGRGYGNNFAGAEPVVSVTLAVSPDQASVVKAVLGQGEMSLSLRGDTTQKGAAAGAHGADAATPNKYTLESILGVRAPDVAGLDRIEIYRGGWSRQHVSFQDDKIVKNEFSAIPGVAPGTPFPVPARLPQAPKSKDDPQSKTEASHPEPHVYDRGGAYGYGGYGDGFGYGNGRGYGRTSAGVRYGY